MNWVLGLGSSSIITPTHATSCLNLDTSDEVKKFVQDIGFIPLSLPLRARLWTTNLPSNLGSVGWPLFPMTYAPSPVCAVSDSTFCGNIYCSNSEQKPLLYRRYLEYLHKGTEVSPEKIFHLTCTPCNIWELENVSEEFVNLESLVLQNCPSLSAFTISRPMRKLQHLTLDNLPFCRGSSLSNLTDDPRGKLPALKRFVIKNCPLFDDFALYEITELLQQKLTFIVLENLPGITAHGLRYLTRAIKSFSGRLAITNITLRDARLDLLHRDADFYAGYFRLRDALRENVLDGERALRMRYRNGYMSSRSYSHLTRSF